MMSIPAFSDQRQLIQEKAGIQSTSRRAPPESDGTLAGHLFKMEWTQEIGTVSDFQPAVTFLWLFEFLRNSKKQPGNFLCQQNQKIPSFRVLYLKIYFFNPSKSWKLYFSHGIILNKIIPKEKFLSSSTKKIKPELPTYWRTGSSSDKSQNIKFEFFINKNQTSMLKLVAR